ncbi:hypothetical protein [Deinococcus kurensis]|uniref:hypothetical protein n=1 Tax=Deinococcus kurensis TaxID=2662757 RepID=UPI0012D2EEC3|nr:hypothetical protein [Deinococcus kurensis]
MLRDAYDLSANPNDRGFTLPEWADRLEGYFRAQAVQARGVIQVSLDAPERMHLRVRRLDEARYRPDERADFAGLPDERAVLIEFPVTRDELRHAVRRAILAVGLNP